MGNNGGTFQLFGNNGNESLLHAWRKYEHI
jgi:hypothetical protein